LEYIGMMDDEPVEPEKGSLMDVLADRMNKSLVYKPDERDMLLMRHDITFTYDSGQRKERITAIMVDYGIPGGDSSMARTVSLPAAIGTRMLLEGRMQASGVHIPVVPEIYNPVLEELDQMNISFTETRSTV
jgi:saccharopine dehydrogenase (NADP+, L-glutamate forming)